MLCYAAFYDIILRIAILCHQSNFKYCFALLTRWAKLSSKMVFSYIHIPRVATLVCVLFRWRPCHLLVLSNLPLISQSCSFLLHFLIFSSLFPPMHMPRSCFSLRKCSLSQEMFKIQHSECMLKGWGSKKLLKVKKLHCHVSFFFSFFFASSP